MSKCPHGTAVKYLSTMILLLQHSVPLTHKSIAWAHGIDMVMYIREFVVKCLKKLIKS